MYLYDTTIITFKQHPCTQSHAVMKKLCIYKYIYIYIYMYVYVCYKEIIIKQCAYYLIFQYFTGK